MELMVTDSDVVEQAKGFLREILDISVEDAYGLLRRYAQVHGDQQAGVATANERARRTPRDPGGHAADAGWSVLLVAHFSLYH
jgi:hypothetical protein